MIEIFIPKKELVKKIKAYYEEVNHYQDIKVKFDCQVRPASLMERPLFRPDKKWAFEDNYVVSTSTKISGILDDKRRSQFSHELEPTHLQTIMEYSMDDDVYDIVNVDYATSIRPTLFSNKKVAASVDGLFVYVNEKNNTKPASSNKVFEKSI